MDTEDEEFINFSVDVPVDIHQTIEQYNEIAKRPVDISQVMILALEEEVAKIEAKTGDRKYFHKVGKCMLGASELPGDIFYGYFLHLLEEDGFPLHDKFATLHITDAKRIKLDNGRVESVLFTGHDCSIQLQKDGVYERFNDSENQAMVEEYRAAESLVTKIETYRRVDLGNDLIGSEGSKDLEGDKCAE